MRLLNSISLDFRAFNDEQLPPYAILSHTWGNEEISYQEQRLVQRLAALPHKLRHDEAYVASLEIAAGLDFCVTGRNIKSRAAYHKIERTAVIARQMGLRWFWVDTCCIDKSSSAELQEAINSMYRWYEKSAYCVVYLEEAKSAVNLVTILKESRWITRGW